MSRFVKGVSNISSVHWLLGENFDVKILPSTHWAVGSLVVSFVERLPLSSTYWLKLTIHEFFFLTKISFEMLIQPFKVWSPKRVASIKKCIFYDIFLAHCKLLLDDDIRLWKVNTFRCPDWLFGNPWANQFTPIFSKFFDHLIYNQKISWFALRSFEQDYVGSS